MKAIVDNSFLKDHMSGLGGMPKGVMKLIDNLGLKSDTDAESK